MGLLFFGFALFWWFGATVGREHFKRSIAHASEAHIKSDDQKLAQKAVKTAFEVNWGGMIQISHVLNTPLF